jgi:hypothetical protein
MAMAAPLDTRHFGVSVKPYPEMAADPPAPFKTMISTSLGGYVFSLDPMQSSGGDANRFDT